MWWAMGRRDEEALKLMEEAAHEYFAVALVEGSYRGFLAVAVAGEVVGGPGLF
jgi:hypothetical protein